MNGIKMSDCKFYVDEPSRVVVCVIPNTEGLLNDFIWDNFDFPDVDLASNKSYKFESTQIKMPRSFSGKAVCAPEDEWNEELGKLIAFSKAKDKCYKSFFKRANGFVQTIDRRLGDIIQAFNDFGMKLENKRELIQIKIDEQMKKEGDA